MVIKGKQREKFLLLCVPWLFLFLISCGGWRTVPLELYKKSDEKYYSLGVGGDLKVPLRGDELFTYNFLVSISTPALYSFETYGDNDTLCGLAVPGGREEKFVVVKDVGGAGDNCKISWFLPQGNFLFKVRIDGSRWLGVKFYRVRSKGEEVYSAELGKSYENTFSSPESLHYYKFFLESPRFVEFSVSSSTTLQCLVFEGWKLRSPFGIRQPDGECRLSLRLGRGSYRLLVRSESGEKVKYILRTSQLRMRELRANQLSFGYIISKADDIYYFKVERPGLYNIITYGERDLDCRLEDGKGETVAVSETASDKRNCFFSGLFTPGEYFVRVKLLRGRGGPYQIALIERDFTPLPLRRRLRVKPPFEQPAQLFMFEVQRPGLYRISAGGRKLKCHLRSSLKLERFNLSKNKLCQIYIRMFPGRYFLEIFPLERTDRHYWVQVSPYRLPSDDRLLANRPHLIGPVFPGFTKVFSIKVETPQIVSLETKGKIDTYCELLDSNKRRLAYNDDGGTGLNCRLSRFLKPGEYSLFLRVNGGRSGSFWVFRSSRDLPKISIGKTLTIKFSKFQKSVAFLFKVEKKGMYAFYTVGKYDTICRILNTDWQQLYRDDDGGSGRNCFIATPLFPGTYAIEVNLYRRTRAEVKLKSKRLKLIHLPLNEKVKISQNGKGELQFFSFSIHRPGLYKLYTSGEVDTRCILLDQSGKAIASNDDFENDKNCFILEFLLPGNYIFQVLPLRVFRKYWTAQPHYSVALERYETPLKKLLLDKTFSGYLSPGKVERFEISVDRPGRYRIETFGFSDPKCILYDDKYRVLARDDDRGQGRNCRLSKYLPAGKYELHIRPASSSRNRGPYRVKFSKGE